MKYRFEITHIPDRMQQVNGFMKKLDLDFEAAIKDAVTFSINKEPLPDIATIKKDLKMAFESLESKVLQIEGGTLE